MAWKRLYLWPANSAIGYFSIKPDTFIGQQATKTMLGCTGGAENRPNTNARLEPLLRIHMSWTITDLILTTLRYFEIQSFNCIADWYSLPPEGEPALLSENKKGGFILESSDGYSYKVNATKMCKGRFRQYWVCRRRYTDKCKARAVTLDTTVLQWSGVHSHEPQ